MIRRVVGEIVEKNLDYIVLMCHGIGFQVFIPRSCYDRLPLGGDEITLYIYMSVKEDSISLYGFIEPEQLAVFELVTSVSGIGPKIAMQVVGTTEPTQFYLSILNENINQLTKIPGIGKKSAQRIVLELKEKVKDLTQVEGVDPNIVDNQSIPNVGQKDHKLTELRDALTALGYTEKEITRGIERLQGTLAAEDNLENLLRLTLQELTKG